MLASITVLTLDFRDSGPVQVLRNGAARVFSPFRSAADAATEPFRDTWNGVTGYDDLEQENERLRRRIDQLEGENVGGEVARRQNADLKEALRIDDVTDIPTVAARVVSGPLTSFDATVEINRGSGDGVKRGMAVITDAGLVGRIARVTGNRASIQLITDPSFAFGVRLLEGGDVAIARGKGRGGKLTVTDGIVRTTPVAKGDDVITSGLQDSTLPPDINVGQVTAIGVTDDRTEKTLELEPAANLRGLSYVTVLLCDDNCT